MGRTFSMSRAWERNQAMIEKLDQKEGHYEGAEKAPKKKIGPQKYEYSPNATLGLDGDHFRIGDRLVNNIKEERLENGDINVYWQSEDHKTYVTRHEQTDERGYTQTTRPKRVTTF